MYEDIFDSIRHAAEKRNLLMVSGTKVQIHRLNTGRLGIILRPSAFGTPAADLNILASGKIQRRPVNSGLSA